MLLLPVGAQGRSDVHGRIITLHAWLRQSVILYPAALWIGKADDDAYVVTPSWLEQLNVLRRALSPKDKVYYYY